MKKTINNNLINQIKTYLANIQYERNLSVITINSYMQDLTQFADYMCYTYNIKNVKNINAKQIRDYILFVSKYTDQSNNIVDKKASSITRSISSIKSYFKYLISNNIIKLDPTKIIEAPKQSKKIPIILSVDEINLILSNFNTNCNNDIRDKALVSMLYSCGLRVSEITNLTLTN